MSELGPIIGRLHQDVARVDWPDPGEIRARGARRAARRTATVTALAVLLVGGAAATAVATAYRPDQASPPPLPPSRIVSTPPSTAPASPSAAPSSAAPVPVPAGFVARDLTYVSQNTGWLLGVRPCVAGTCPAIVHTTDGGHTWTPLPAPPADVPVDGVGIRFANTQVGYLYGSTMLYLTRDGGMTWTRQPGHAEALEILNGTVLRASSTQPACGPACTYQVSRAAIGGSQWQTVVPQTAEGIRVQIERTGHRAFIMVYRNLAGGSSAHGQLLTSGDDGATWATRDDPCGTYQGAEAAGAGMTVADDGSMTMLCQVRGGPANGTALVLTSTDGGAGFGPPRPVGHVVLGVGAASATTLLVSALDGNTSRLYRSTDGGTTWTAVATSPDRVPDGPTPTPRLGFQNSHAGEWLTGQATVFTTTDAGRGWTAYTFPR